MIIEAVLNLSGMALVVVIVRWIINSKFKELDASLDTTKATVEGIEHNLDGEKENIDTAQKNISVLEERVDTHILDCYKFRTTETERIMKKLDSIDKNVRNHGEQIARLESTIKRNNRK